MSKKPLSDLLRPPRNSKPLVPNLDPTSNHVPEDGSPLPVAMAPSADTTPSIAVLEKKLSPTTYGSPYSPDIAFLRTKSEKGTPVRPTPMGKPYKSEFVANILNFSFGVNRLESISSIRRIW